MSLFWFILLPWLLFLKLKPMWLSQPGVCALHHCLTTTSNSLSLHTHSATDTRRSIRHTDHIWMGVVVVILGMLGHSGQAGRKNVCHSPPISVATSPTQETSHPSMGPGQATDMPILGSALFPSARVPWWTSDRTEGHWIFAHITPDCSRVSAWESQIRNHCCAWFVHWFTKCISVLHVQLGQSVQN